MFYFWTVHIPVRLVEQGALSWGPAPNWNELNRAPIYSFSKIGTRTARPRSISFASKQSPFPHQSRGSDQVGRSRAPSMVPPPPIPRAMVSAWPMPEMAPSKRPASTFPAPPPLPLCTQHSRNGKVEVPNLCNHHTETFGKWWVLGG